MDKQLMPAWLRNFIAERRRLSFNSELHAEETRQINFFLDELEKAALDALTASPKPVAAPKQCLAEQIFEGRSAQSNLEDAMCERGLGSFQDTSFDSYDSSVEFHGCAPDMRLSDEVQAWLWELGFCTCWLNHTDDMETMYTRLNPERNGAHYRSPEHRIAARRASSPPQGGAQAEPLAGYVEAFYKIAAILNIPAQSKTPAAVFKEQILPRLQALLAASQPQVQEPVAWMDEFARFEAWAAQRPDLSIDLRKHGNGYWTDRTCALFSAWLAAAPQAPQAPLAEAQVKPDYLHRLIDRLLMPVAASTATDEQELRKEAAEMLGLLSRVTQAKRGYYCNKCGYIGGAVQHRRSDGWACNYDAVAIDRATEAAKGQES